MIVHPSSDLVHSCPGHDHVKSTKSRTHDPHQLAYPERGRWEDAVKATAGVKGSRMLILRVLLDCCRGKPWCMPGDAYLIEKAGLAASTVSQCLTDLGRRGIIRIVRHRGSLRRYCVILSHPRASAYLAQPGIHAWKCRIPPEKNPVQSPDSGEQSPDLGDRSPDAGEPLEGLEREKSTKHTESTEIVVVDVLTPSDNPTPPAAIASDGPGSPVDASPPPVRPDRPSIPAIAQPGDYELLMARGPQRVSGLTDVQIVEWVTEFGLDSVLIAVCGLTLRNAWGVRGACRIWLKGPAGPTVEEVKRAREVLGLWRPRRYHQAPPPSTAGELAESKAFAAEMRAFLAKARTAG